MERLNNVTNEVTNEVKLYKYTAEESSFGVQEDASNEFYGRHNSDVFRVVIPISAIGNPSSVNMILFMNYNKIKNTENKNGTDIYAKAPAELSSSKYFKLNIPGKITSSSIKR